MVKLEGLCMSILTQFWPEWGRRKLQRRRINEAFLAEIYTHDTGVFGQKLLNPLVRYCSKFITLIFAIYLNT